MAAPKTSVATQESAGGAAKWTLEELAAGADAKVEEQPAKKAGGASDAPPLARVSVSSQVRFGVFPLAHDEVAGS